MTLDAGHLRLVVTIAEAGTLTAAAAALYKSQSALSRQLAALERRLGTLLFERSGTGMRLTPAGERLVDEAGVILTRLRDLEEDVMRIARGDVGRIRVTTQCHTGYQWLPKVLPRFTAEYPEVDFRIVPEAAAAPIEALIEDRVDLALGYDFTMDEGFSRVPLFEDELVLLVPPAHLYADRDHVEASDFADQHLLAYSDDPQDSWFHQTVLRPAGIVPARLSGVRLTEGLVALVAGGAGVAVLTRWTAAKEIASGLVRTVSIGRHGLRRTWSAVARPAAMQRPYMMRFVALVAEGPAPLFRPAPESVREAAAIRVLP